MLKRWLSAAIALAFGGGVTAVLLAVASPAPDSQQAYALAHDVPAGAQLGAGALVLRPVGAGLPSADVFTRGDYSALVGQRATHDLASGQLIQRTDVSPAAADERLLFRPVKDAPPVAAGSSIDLFVVTGSPDSPAVEPFAAAVGVRGSAPGGVIVAVPADRAAAFVYAAETMRLVAVVTEVGAGSAPEEPVTSAQQAMEVAARQ